MKGDSKVPRLLHILVIVCIGVIGIVAYTHPFVGIPEERINWNLTLIGEEEKVLSFDEIRAMHSYEGYGGFFTTVGMVNGPLKCKGIPVEDLCELVGGIEPSNTLRVSAPDGYLMVFTYDQCKGNFVTYEPATLKEVPHGDLKMILMYKQDGTLLSEDDGKPLRLAIVGSDKLLTEGHYWVKWVDTIEVRR